MRIRFKSRVAVKANVPKGPNPAKEYIEKAMALSANKVKYPYMLRFPVALKLLGYSREQAHKIIFDLYRTYWGESKESSEKLAEIHAAAAYDPSPKANAVSNKAKAASWRVDANSNPIVPPTKPKSGILLPSASPPGKVMKIKPINPVRSPNQSTSLLSLLERKKP